MTSSIRVGFGASSLENLKSPSRSFPDTPEPGKVKTIYRKIRMPLLVSEINWDVLEFQSPVRPALCHAQTGAWLAGYFMRFPIQARSCARAQVIKPAGQQFTRVSGVVHVHGVPLSGNPGNPIVLRPHRQT